MNDTLRLSSLARGYRAPAAEQSFGRGPGTASLSHALDTELMGSLNVHRTALRILDLARTHIADWALLVLDDPRLRAVHVTGGDDHRFAETLRTADALPTAGRPERHQWILGGDENATGGLDASLTRLLQHPELARQARTVAGEVLVTPLTARSRTAGALLLGRRTGQPFDDEDLGLARQLADRAALALDAAWIYEDHSRVTRVLEEGLRPPTLPELPDVDIAACFRPAVENLEIGGDFYDVHPGNGDHLVVLGDVCGKGVDAAVLNARARQSIRTAVHFERRPGQILPVVNDALYEPGSDRFVTLACARVRSVSSVRAEVDLAVAGHPAPLIVRADGEVEEPSVRGRLAGVMLHDDPYEETTFSLEPGDALVLFSDGIYEAPGSDGLYGLTRLRRLLSSYAGSGAAALCETVEQDVVEHLEGRGHDDMSAVVLSPRTWS